jgi:hypothetical protein
MNNSPAKKPIDASILKRSRVNNCRLKIALKCSEILAVKGTTKTRRLTAISGSMIVIINKTRNKNKFSQGKMPSGLKKILSTKHNNRKIIELA